MRIIETTPPPPKVMRTFRLELNEDQLSALQNLSYTSESGDLYPKGEGYDLDIPRLCQVIEDMTGLSSYGASFRLADAGYGVDGKTITWE